MRFLMFIIEHPDFKRSLWSFFKAILCTSLFWVIYEVLVFLGMPTNETREVLLLYSIIIINLIVIIQYIGSWIYIYINHLKWKK